MAMRSDAMELMIAAAGRAGDGLRLDFSRLDQIQVKEKGASDFVSDADLRSQEILRDALTRGFPGHALLMEEGELAQAAPGQPRFYVDPLDGTSNFLHGIPHFAVSIALEAEGEVVAGTVLSPMSGELYWAEKGRGAWLGDRRLAVSPETDFGRAIAATGIPHRGGRHHDAYLRALANLMRDVAGIRRCGAAALDLAFVAAGRFETFFELGLAPWDVAAGTLMVREAGGVVTECDGSPPKLTGKDILACASPSVQASMVRRLEPLHGRASMVG